ncbi:MAG: sigma-70 family RNA polymerase sigma factor [Chitinophagaceae bacterium]
MRSRDERAFQYVYDNYSQALYGIVFKVVEHHELANDILQEVFIKIWRNIDQYDSSKGRLYTWMLNIARNTAIDTLRSKGYRNEQKTTDVENTVYTGDPKSVTTQNTDTIGLKKTVMTLKKDLRDLVDMAYFQGYTQEEISKTLDIPLGTVKTRLRNALIELKSIFK